MQLQDAFCGQQRLPLLRQGRPLLLVLPVALLLPGLAQHMHLQRRIVLPLRQAADEPLPLVVFDFGIAARHQLLKDGVDPGEDIAAGAEIAVQIDPARPLCPPVCVQRSLFSEERRQRAAEAVDALLDIAHLKQRVRPPQVRKRGEDGLLHGAGVLVFVHEDVAVMLGQRFPHRRIFPRQRAQRLPLQVVKVQDTPPPLRSAVQRAVGLRQLDEAGQRPRGRTQVRSRLLRRGQKRLDHVVQRGAEVAAAPFDLLHALPVAVRRRPAGKPRQADPFFLERQRRRGVVQGPVAALPRRSSQPFHEFKIAAAGCRIACRHAGAAQFQRDPGLLFQLSEVLRGLVQQQPDGLSGEQRPVVPLKGGSRPLHPRIRVGLCVRKSQQASGHIRKAVFRKATVCRKKSFASRFIAAVERILHRRGAQHRALLLVTDPEGGVEVQQLKVLPQQVSAKAVQRGNLRLSDAKALVRQKRPLRSFGR